MLLNPHEMYWNPNNRLHYLADNCTTDTYYHVKFKGVYINCYTVRPYGKLEGLFEVVKFRLELPNGDIVSRQCTSIEAAKRAITKVLRCAGVTKGNQP